MDTVWTVNTEACSETKPASQMWWFPVNDGAWKEIKVLNPVQCFLTYHEVTKCWAIRERNLSDMKLLLERWSSAEVLLLLEVMKFLCSKNSPNTKNPITVEAFRSLFPSAGFYTKHLSLKLCLGQICQYLVQCLALYPCTYQCAFCLLQWEILLHKSVGAVTGKPHTINILQVSSIHPRTES